MLDNLAVETREFVRLAVIDAHALAWIADAQGARGGLMYQPLPSTNTVPLHATASGKSWLARLPPTQVHHLIAHNGGFGEPGQYGPNAVRSFAQLFAELEHTLARGYGIAVGEAEPGVTAVAAAIISGVEGHIVGTVSVAAPNIRLGPAQLNIVGRRVIDAAGQWPDAMTDVDMGHFGHFLADEIGEPSHRSRYAPLRDEGIAVSASARQRWRDFVGEAVRAASFARGRVEGGTISNRAKAPPFLIEQVA